MVFTHNHLEHFDPKTVAKTKDTAGAVLAPYSVWKEIKTYQGEMLC